MHGILAPVIPVAQHCVKMADFSENASCICYLSMNAVPTHCIKKEKSREFVCACAKAVIAHALLMNHLDGKPINLITRSYHNLLFIRPL